MASLIPGFEYDIFISYRQKDNKGDHWVSEFVEALKTELESTFKEEISVYFDINPHDGLLEIYDVDASLKVKLKCLIFIPVISRTYCDPKSFAWEHEFKAFIEMASKDQFGLKINLPNRNVASRVLPVRIYDLPDHDIKLCESVLGGFMRSIDFVYSEAGVNRPLKSDDDENKNLNKTKYRNQINKVGNAIGDIISGMKNSFEAALPGKSPFQDASPDLIEKRRANQIVRPKIFTFILTTLMILVGALLIFTNIFRHDDQNRLLSGSRIAIAVMPFQNMTADSILNIWQDGIQDNLITALSNSPDILVRHKEFVNRLLQKEEQVRTASLIPSTKVVSQKLDVDIFITGSINRFGNNARINAQLVDISTDEVLKSFQISGSFDNLLVSIDSLSSMVIDFLGISRIIKELPSYMQRRPTTSSPEAFRYYLLGENARSKRDYSTAIKFFSQALSLDSNYISMKLMLSIACINQGLYVEGRKWSDQAYEKINQMPVRLQIFTNSNYAFFHETPLEQIKYLEKFLEIDDKFPGTYYDIGLKYNSLFQYTKAIPQLEKAIQLYDQMEMKPWWVFNYLELGYAYHNTGKYKKEEKLYKKADADFPNETSLVWRKAILYLTKGDTATANKFIRQYRGIYKEKAWPEAALERNLGWAYTQSGLLDKAEISFRRSMNLDKTNAFWTYYLAYFLIDKNRNISEGLELADRALELSNGQYQWIFLDCKGLGLYKLGKYREAQEMLQKSWDLRRANAEYNHEAFLHLEAANKAMK